MEYEYKKADGMSVGQVVDSRLDDIDFFIKQDGEFLLIVGEIAVQKLKELIDKASLYTRTEKHWWEEGFRGMLVMARDYDEQDWRYDTFYSYASKETYKFRCRTLNWRQARPLTTAERDAIKVRD